MTLDVWMFPKHQHLIKRIEGPIYTEVPHTLSSEQCFILLHYMQL